MNSNRGFTLIEVMIVLAILAGIMALGAPRLFKKNVNIKSQARKIMVLAKETRTKARLNNSTYRLAIKFDGDANEYWVERGSGPIKVDPESYKERSSFEKEDAPPSPYQMDKSLTKKEQHLESGLKFGSLETSNMEAPASSGLAYIHFFPQGFVEASALQITDGKNLTWTLVFNPLTGQADIIEKATTLKDIER